MGSFELNKVLGAVLGTCLFLLAVHIASGAIFTPPTPAKPGYEIAVPETPAGGAAPAAPAEVPIESMLPGGSIKQGQADVRVCQACHNFQKGQGNNVGPNLYGVVGRPVASIVGFTGYSGLSVYSATKASLLGFTRSLAREVGKMGVNVNAVAPGFVDTEMTQDLTDEKRQKIVNRSALRRLTSLDDVANAVEFLLSDKANSITGTVLTVDAGNTA